VDPSNTFFDSQVTPGLAVEEERWMDIDLGQVSAAIAAQLKSMAS